MGTDEYKNCTVERVRTLCGEAAGRAGLIRTVLADDPDAVSSLNAKDPVLLTRAEHERLGDDGL